MQKLLVIGYVWPEPNSSAAGAQMLSILRAYKQQGWQVTFATPAQKTPFMADLTMEGIESQPIKINDNSFDEYVLTYKPDIVHFDRFLMEEQFGWRIDQCCPNALKILDTVDLQCLRTARKNALHQKRNVEKVDLYNEIAIREIAAILRCDLSLIISDYEMELLKSQFNVDEALLQYVPFMIDENTITQKTNPFENRAHFVTIGNFRHAPNWDAVLYLQTLWPMIRQQLPTAELQIYGAYAPAKAMKLHNPKTGFLVKGTAKSVTTIMEQAKVCLAPLRFGAGIKGKLLDAMLAQTPSVTTSIGKEGMSLVDTPWPGAVEDDPERFVIEAVDLYLNQEKWNTAQGYCLKHIKDKFNREIHAKRLIERIASIQKSLNKHRLNNFNGQMLKHHTMNSTKYMSRWIMEKNKSVNEFNQ